MNIGKVTISLLLVSGVAWGQNITAQISGTVKDSTGLAVPDAEVKVTQTATGAVRTTTSRPDGGYVLPNLLIGPYVLEVNKSGFAKYVQSGIVLQVDANPTIDATLKVGSVNEQVTVQADANLVETHSTGVGTVIDQQRVEELPLNGRNVTELVYLSGMATVGYSGGFLTSTRSYPTIAISVAGGVANWTQYNWDGAGHNDPYVGLNLPLPFPDALQEFKVQSSALPAQYGQHASANVDIVTKSGTNQFHGDAFEFLRNNDFNARDFFAPARDTLKRNQLGGTVGGPVIRNKLFFFAGYQLTLLHTTPQANIGYIPTPAMLTGDFTTFAGPGCNGGKQISLSPAAGFVGNMISPSLFSPAAQKIAAILPISTADQCGKVTYGLPANQTENMGVAKVDWQKSDKNSMYIRTFVTNLFLPTSYDGKNALTTANNAETYRVSEVALGNTYLFGSALVSSFHFGLNRATSVEVPFPFYSWLDLGVNAPYQRQDGPNGCCPSERFTVSGGNGLSYSAAASTSNRTGPDFNISEDLSWVKGSHQIQLGGTYNRVMTNYGSATNSDGNFTFNGTATGGLGWADFMIGKASLWKEGNYQSYLYNRQNYVGMYVQDSWKATARLTVNYGVRWEPFFPFTNKDGYFDHFDPALFAANGHSTLYPNAPAGMIFPGDPQWTPGGNKIANNRYGEFLPRLGLVWDPKGDGKTSIRASVGMFTDRGGLYSLSAMAQDSPYGAVVQVNNVSLDNPWATYPGGNPLPYVLSKTSTFPAGASFSTANFDWKPTWVNQFSLSVQRQLGANWLVTANYVGNTVSHLINAGQIDPALFFGTGPCSFPATSVLPATSFPSCGTTASNNYRRVYYTQNPSQGGYYGPISTTDDGGTSSYNALFLQAQKRLSKGMTILSNYTWSHCIADQWNGNPGNNGASSVTPFNRRNDRGNCNISDQRQLLNLSLVAMTPKFSNRMLRLLASDWQIAPIMKIRSSQFYTVKLGSVDQALNGEGGQRANAVTGANPYVSDHNACTNAPCVAWSNAGAYALPALGTLGTLSSASLRGPGTFQLDMAVSRTFPVWGEKRTLQIRAEAFNLPNHLNAAAPAPNVGSANSFTITSDISGTSGLTAGDYRVIQLATKFVF